MQKPIIPLLEMSVPQRGNNYELIFLSTKWSEVRVRYRTVTMVLIEQQSLRGSSFGYSFVL